MAKEYVCDKCGRIFYQKGHYTNHQKRKKPCKLIENKGIEEKVQKKLQELSDNGDIEIKNTNLILDIDNNKINNIKKELGQFYTKNYDYILQNIYLNHP